MVAERIGAALDGGNAEAMQQAKRLYGEMLPAWHAGRTQGPDGDALPF